MKRSLHILADLHECNGHATFFTHKPKVRSYALRSIRRAGFKIVASRFHKFPATSVADGGITGVVIVSESHMTIHTWPERQFVNLDVFFCNYTRDNTRKARAVFREFRAIYHPKRIRMKEVWRD